MYALSVGRTFEMTPEEWNHRYIERLVQKGQMTYREARGCLKDWMGQPDYKDNPENAADEEMSHWSIVDA